MKIIGLVSGGKDSILSLMIAKVMGHEPIVLANLYAAPPTATPSDVSTTATAALLEDHHLINAEEVDSFMFQTVGHSVIPSIAECCELPLRRKSIQYGQSRVQALDYTLKPDPEDEVEVMFQLLQSIKLEFPEVRGVVSGAILSHYQRLRVEAVCHRLGLTSIAPMWQLKAGEVLSLVAAAGVDARLIKVATFGLTPKKHLGRSLLEDALRNELLHLQSTVQLHAAGEGGEFESLVVDCPLFPSKKIQILETRTFVDAEQPDVAALGVTKHAVVTKSQEEMERDETLRRRFNEKDCDVLAATLKMRWTPTTLHHKSNTSPRSDDVENAKTVLPERLFSSDELTFPSAAETPQDPSVLVVRRFLGANTTTNGSSDLQPDVVVAGASELFTSIHKWLEGCNREALFLLIVCPSMTLFLPVNKVYELHFEIVRPPGRAFVEDSTISSLCVEVWSIPRRAAGAESGDDEDEKAFHLLQERKCLHVQSISPWAAASIGPYAQANRVWYCLPSCTSAKDDKQTLKGIRKVDHTIVSGRIGMVPLTQNVAAYADLQAAANHSVLSSTSPPSQPLRLTGSMGDALWGSFLAEFMFMMANSVVGLEHFNVPLRHVTHATFFVPSKLFSTSTLALKDAHILIETAWGLYWSGITDDAVAPASPRGNPIDWVPTTDFITELNNGGCGVSAGGSTTRARLLLTTGLPKGALVEVILERRIVEPFDDD